MEFGACVHLWHRRLVQPFPDFGCEATPDGVHRYNLVVQFREGKSQERINASRFEMDTVKLNWLRPIHDPILAPQPDPPTLATGRKRCSLIRRIYLERLAEVHHQV